MLKAAGQRGHSLLRSSPGKISTFVGGGHASGIQTRCALNQGLEGDHDFRAPVTCLLLCETKTRQMTGEGQ